MRLEDEKRKKRKWVWLVVGWLVGWLVVWLAGWLAGW